MQNKRARAMGAPLFVSPDNLSAPMEMTMSHIAHAIAGRFAAEQQKDPINWAALRLTLVDYAEVAFVLMSVAFSPALVWLLLWMADR
jgi:hypothetical protein